MLSEEVKDMTLDYLKELVAKALSEQEEVSHNQSLDDYENKHLYSGQINSLGRRIQNLQDCIAEINNIRA